MHLVEILLPVAGNDGQPFHPQKYTDIRAELTRRFGGMTAFARAPAHGEFHDRGAVVHDDIIVFEVMSETLDSEWWAAFRKRVEQEFAQDEIVIRASTITRL